MRDRDFYIRWQTSLSLHQLTAPMLKLGVLEGQEASSAAESQNCELDKPNMAGSIIIHTCLRQNIKIVQCHYTAQVLPVDLGGSHVLANACGRKLQSSKGKVRHGQSDIKFVHHIRPEAISDTILANWKHHASPHEVHTLPGRGDAQELTITVQAMAERGSQHHSPDDSQDRMFQNFPTKRQSRCPKVNTCLPAVSTPLKPTPARLQS